MSTAPTRDLPRFLVATGKALAAVVVAAAAYLVGIMSEGETLADLTTVQLLGLVVFLGTAFGITYHAPYRPLHRADG